MFQKIIVLIDGPIQSWIEQQGRKFKISKFVRVLGTALYRAARKRENSLESFFKIRNTIKKV